MANVKISQLPTASAVTGDDFVAMVDSGSLATQQASFEKVLNYVTSSTFNTLTVTSLTASVSGTFVGDGSGITGVTGEWDGTHTGNAEITGTLSIKNGHVNLAENAYFFQGSSTGGSNVSLIGVNSSDQIFIGNSGYQNIIDDGTYVSGNLEVSGAVGIGITSPSELLDVRTSTPVAGQGARIGQAKIGTWESNSTYAAFTHNSVHATANSFALLQSSAGETFLNTSAGNALWFRQNNNTTMVIDSAGDVGIGTTSPSAKLDVTEDILVNSLTVGKGASSVATNTAFGYTALNSITTAQYNTAVGYEALSSLVSSPNSYNTAVGYRAGTSATGYGNTFIGASVGTSITTGVYNTIIGSNYAGAAAQSQTVVIADGVGNARFYADSAGNVGLGTVSPGSYSSGAKNLVITNAAADAGLTIHSNGASEGRIYFAEAVSTGVASRRGQVVYDHAADDMYFATSFTERMRIDSAGNVGIGTTSPSEKLEVVGNSIFSGSVEVSGTLRADVEVSGNITAASYTLSAADYGKTLLFSSSATQDITCSSGLDVGYNVTVIQAGTGQLNFSGSGVTLVNRFAHTSSAGQYSAVSVIVLNGTQYLVVGDTA